MYKRSSTTPIDPQLEQALQMVQEAERLEVNYYYTIYLFILHSIMLE